MSDTSFSYIILNKIISKNINFIYDLYNIRTYCVTYFGAYYNLFWNNNYNEIKYNPSDVMNPLHQ